jgi:DNA-binding LacI/PurR family transcriptional regulator
MSQGQQRISMADIARKLNISRATVSYVLNERESELISESTRERVLAAAREMGYRPNRAAQALAGKRSNLIELCVYGFHPAFYSHILSEFETQIAPTPYQLHIVSARHWTSEDWETLDSGWPVDGLIVFDAALLDRAAADLQNRGVPVVASGAYPLTSVDHVSVDTYSSVFEATTYLVERAQRVAYVTPWTLEISKANPDPRYPAYAAALHKAWRPEEVIVATDQNGVGNRAAMYDVLSAYIKEKGCPDALLCFNDEIAIGTLAALRRLQIRVPEDVMLIGCDGIEETAYHSPSLSTIQFPYADVARLSWEFLRRRIEDPATPLQSATLKPQLLLRESSAREE